MLAFKHFPKCSICGGSNAPIIDGKHTSKSFCEPYMLLANGQRLKLALPELRDKRGHHTCCVCGSSTRSVLDGEAWCDKCQRYQ